MRRVSLLPSAFVVAAAAMFAASGTASADDCNQSCAKDCQGKKGGEKNSCMLSCHAGRCGNPGALNVAEQSGLPGIDCEADGVCNAFCELTPDPDCFSFPPGHVGFAVEFLAGGVSVAPGVVVVLGDAAYTAHPSGAVGLSLPPCTSDGCYNEAYTNSEVESVAAGTEINFKMVQTEGLPNARTEAYCWVMGSDGDPIPECDQIIGMGGNYSCNLPADHTVVYMFCEIRSSCHEPLGCP